jgi:2-keto-4-pentenoate hydratase/2-oxohepta-3-ene-1,7-dioic acid hydratase in catechol pathway
VRIARFAAGDEVSYGLVGTAREGGATSQGVAAGGEIIAELAGHPFGGGRDSIRLTGTTYPLADVRLLAPVLPSKVIGFARAGPADGSGTADGLGDGSVMYLKPSTAVCGPADPVQYPAGLARRVVAEGALAVVIGRLCRQVPPDQAAAVMFGYTCAADITARDLEERDGQWARARGFDTFCPLGPWIETGAGSGALTVSVNGQARQRGDTARLRDAVPALVAYASSVMTLLPGDVLLAGVSAGGGTLEPGDEISVTIDGIGTLTNKVDKGD